MPLFPPVTDTLRWDDLVRQGRSQLPLVAPEWTDQNTSDPGIALLELISWLVEVDSYRSGAVSERETRLLLALAGIVPEPARAARCLVRPTSAAGGIAPAGLTADGDPEGQAVPLTLVDDIVVTGAAVAAVVWAGAEADAAAYLSDCSDLTREWAAGRVIAPLGTDPRSGDALLLGLRHADRQIAGMLDLWIVAADGPEAAEVPGPPEHHSATTAWEAWDGLAWVTVIADDDTAALSRSGRVRLDLPVVPASPLGDQADGVLAGRTLSWLRCRLDDGRHDAAPALAAVHVDVGEAIASRAYDAAGGAVLGVATGVPNETMRLSHPWCDAPPVLSLGDTPPYEALTTVADLAHAGPRTRAVVFESDGLTVRFGDGRRGATLPEKATVRVAGAWTTVAGTGEIGPPLAVTVHQPSSFGLELVSGLRSGAPAEDLATAAARAEASLWVHDRLGEAVGGRGAASLDDLPLDVVRRLGVPERAITALDIERLALAIPGVALARARALPQVDPRLPGLVADGCVTVVIVPWLPAGRPEPTRGALRRVRAELATARTVGTRIFVVGPTYVSIAVEATVVARRGVSPQDAVASATTALLGFLHPVTGGPTRRGWTFGRAVRRTEILQLLDERPEIDRVEGLALSREIAGRPPGGDCGDVALCPTELALAGTLSIAVRQAGGGS
jgi:predicted phage baseplate assembly protein